MKKTHLISFFTHANIFRIKNKTYPIDQQVDNQDNDSTLYPCINSVIEYGIFKDIISSYHLDSEIKDDFHCDPNCYNQDQSTNQSKNLTSCTHALDSTVQQQQLHDMEEDSSIFTTDTGTSCNFNIDKPLENSTHDSNHIPKAQLHTIMTLILVTHYLTETNTLLFYNKNCKTLTGIYIRLPHFMEYGHRDYAPCHVFLR